MSRTFLFPLAGFQVTFNGRFWVTAEVQGEENAWRRRGGSYRLLFEIDIKGLTVDVLDLRRRTSTTY